MSVAAVGEVSGLSNGAIYWRFETMDALVQAVHQRIVERLVREHELYDDPARWDGLAVGELVTAMVRVEADIFRRYAAPLRVLALASASDERLAERGAEAVRRAERRWVSHLVPRLTEAGCAQTDVLAASVFRVVYGAFATRVIWPEHQAEPQIPWDAFVAAVAEMIRLYVEDAISRGPAEATARSHRKAR